MGDAEWNGRLWWPRWSNCFIWAWAMYYRHGGYVAIRQSDHGWWKHRLWSPDRSVWYAYTPLMLGKGAGRKLLYRGFVEINDAGHEEHQWPDTPKC